MVTAYCRRLLRHLLALASHTVVPILVALFRTVVQIVYLLHGYGTSCANRALGYRRGEYFLNRVFLLTGYSSRCPNITDVIT